MINQKTRELILVCVATAALAVACDPESETLSFEIDGQRSEQAPSASRADSSINPRLLNRFRPISGVFRQQGVQLNGPIIQLGKRLFHDKQLSADGTVACASCHDIAKGGVDGEKTSLGVGGKRGGRNAPTVLNAAGHFRQFWDGRAATVEEQAGGPILNPIEMAMPSKEAVEVVLRNDPSYKEQFHQAYPHSAEPITFANATAAIAAFERTLVVRSRWDEFLEGDESALTNVEKQGLKTFLGVGCMVCHTGAMVGGATFERAGVVEPWPNQADQGRFDLTKSEGDRMVFKVPSLRNINLTAPYFHDGSAATIEDAIRMMGRHQLGLELADDEVVAIVAWFGSMSGEVATAEVAAAPVATVSAAPVASAQASASGAAPTDAPLRGWMRATAGPAMQNEDAKKLERAFNRIRGFAPPGYDGWVGFANSGATAAARGDLEGARAACASCHGTYRARYVKDLRSRKL